MNQEASRTCSPSRITNGPHRSTSGRSSTAPVDRALAVLYLWGTAWPPPANAGNYAVEEMIPAKVPGRHQSASPCMGYRDAYVETAPEGSFPANALGLHDLGGSVWEWCEDWYDDSKIDRVLRGGVYIAGDRDKLLSSTRNPYRPLSASVASLCQTKGSDDRAKGTATFRRRFC